MSIILTTSIGNFLSFYCCFCSFFTPYFQGCLTCTDRDDWMRGLAPALYIGIGLTFHPASVLSLDELYCPGLWIPASTFLNSCLSHPLSSPPLLLSPFQHSLSLICSFSPLCCILPLWIAEMTVMLHNSLARSGIQFFKITSMGLKLHLLHSLSHFHPLCILSLSLTVL